MNKKINEIYISKQITLIVPYRGKSREIDYIVTSIYGTDFQITAKLKSKKYPCIIPNLTYVEMRLNNEFPTKQLVKKNKIKTMTKKIGYSKTYPILNIGVWEKIWIEEEVPAETDTRTILYALKKQVESFHYESNKADEKKAEKIIINNEEFKPVSVIDAINSCTDTKVLEAYKLIAKGKPELQIIYDNKLKALTS